MPAARGFRGYRKPRARTRCARLRPGRRPSSVLSTPVLPKPIGLRYSRSGSRRNRSMRADKSKLTELGNRLFGESLSDVRLQDATEQTPDFAILPWVNVVKIGGQSIMDRGRS